MATQPYCRQGRLPLDPVHPPIIAIAMGDPAGIGPEVILKASLDPLVRSATRVIVVGDAGWMQATARLLGLQVSIRPVASVNDCLFKTALEVLDLKNAPLGTVEVGRLSAQAGRSAVEAVRVAAGLALEGKIDAIVTAPLNKEAMHLAGFRYPGHTEILAEMTETENYSMLLVTPSLRVFFVTVHVSLRRALNLITTDRVLRTVRVANRSLVRMGFPAPRIAVAGLNPHAGEGGLFGDEDRDEIAPAVTLAVAEGIDASGPWPADTVFARARAGMFDAVVSMYHDQGHIPVKLLGFSDGVNVTVGLPIIRTSVDHGTAFDIAGKGVADHRSMVEAILLAGRLATGHGAVEKPRGEDT